MLVLPQKLSLFYLEKQEKKHVKLDSLTDSLLPDSPGFESAPLDASINNRPDPRIPRPRDR